MAIINGVNGYISGKVGDMVYYIKGGVNYVRKARKVTTPPSALQMANRRKVALSFAFLNPLRALINKVWAHQKNKGKTAYGDAFGYMMQHAFTGDVPEPQVCFDRIRLSKGKMRLPLHVETSRTDSRLLVSWRNEGLIRNSRYIRDEDQAITVLHFPEMETSIVVWDGSRRCDEKQEATIPAVYAGCLVHAWLIFTCSRGLSSSDTLYLGAF